MVDNPKKPDPPTMEGYLKFRNQMQSGDVKTTQKLEDEEFKAWRDNWFKEKPSIVNAVGSIAGWFDIAFPRTVAAHLVESKPMAFDESTTNKLSRGRAGRQPTRKHIGAIGEVEECTSHCVNHADYSGNPQAANAQAKLEAMDR